MYIINWSFNRDTLKLTLLILADKILRKILLRCEGGCSDLDSGGENESSGNYELYGMFWSTVGIPF